MTTVDTYEAIGHVLTGGVGAFILILWEVFCNFLKVALASHAVMCLLVFLRVDVSCLTAAALVVVFVGIVIFKCEPEVLFGLVFSFETIWIVALE
jgi:hypothetical protein